MRLSAPWIIAAVAACGVCDAAGGAGGGTGCEVDCPALSELINLPPGAGGDTADALATNSNNCISALQTCTEAADLSAASGAADPDAETEFEVRFVVSREVRGAGVPVDHNEKQCTSGELADTPCKCFGGASRRQWMFDKLKSAGPTHGTLSGKSTTVAIDTGGYFFGSGRLFTYFNGEASAQLFVEAEYDAAGLSYSDFNAFKVNGSSGLEEYIAEVADVAADQGVGNYPGFVATNYIPAKSDEAGLLTADDVAKYTMVSLASDRNLAVLSVMDPEYVTHPGHSSRFEPFEKAIQVGLSTVIRELADGGDPPPDVVACVVSGFQVTADQVAAAGGNAGAAAVAGLLELATSVIGVDIYLVSGVDALTEVRNITNWAGDSVLIVPIEHARGQYVDVVTVRFNDDGLPLAGQFDVNAYHLSCAVPDSDSSPDIKGMVNGFVQVIEDTSNEAVVGTASEDFPFAECMKEACALGGLVADALVSATGADIGFTNAGGLRSFILQGDVTNAMLHDVLPFLDNVGTISGVTGSTLREILQNGISQLGGTSGSGRLLQLSAEVRIEWYIESGSPALGNVYIADETGGHTLIPRGYEYAAGDRLYTIATNTFVGAGTYDGFTMIASHDLVDTGTTEYEAVAAYVKAKDGTLSKDYTGSDVGCDGSSCVRITQTPDLVVLNIGIFCRDSSASVRQECDHAYHVIDRINDHSDGFFDNILTDARIETSAEHGLYICGDGDIVEARDRLFSAVPNALAVVGPGCSSDVVSIAAKDVRVSTSNPDVVVISASSTAPSIADNEAYPQTVRLATAETAVGAGFAKLCEKYGWERVGIIHDDTVWGREATTAFLREMADLKGITAEENRDMLYTDQETDESRATFSGGDEAFEKARGSSFPIEGARACIAKKKELFNNNYACDGNGEFNVVLLLEDLVRQGAKIIFMAVNTDVQTEIMEQVYINRNDPKYKLWGEGYAWMNALLTEEIFTRDGEVNTNAADGSLGMLGMIESFEPLYPIVSTDDCAKPNCLQDDEDEADCLDINARYKCLWGGEHGLDVIDGVYNEEEACAEVPTLIRPNPDRTDVGGPYCDIDEDPLTLPGYAANHVEAIVAFAKAMDSLLKDPATKQQFLAGNLRDTQKALHDRLVLQAAPPGYNGYGGAGKIVLAQDSGDRDGSFAVLNVHKRTDVQRRSIRGRRAVNLEQTRLELVQVGLYESSSRELDSEKMVCPDSEGKDGVIFSGNVCDPPSDRAPSTKSSSEKASIVAIVVVVVVCVLFGVGFFIFHWMQMKGLQAQLEQLQDTLVGVRIVIQDFKGEAIESPEVEFRGGVEETEMSYLEVGGGAKAPRATAPRIKSGPLSGGRARWYWQEQADRMSAHNVHDTLQPGNWVSYAWAVIAEIEGAYQKFQAGAGPAVIDCDLTNRISSTGIEAKAFGEGTGVKFQIDLMNMMQINASSGFKRPIQRVEIEVARADAGGAAWGDAVEEAIGGWDGVEYDASVIGAAGPADLAKEDKLVLFTGQLIQVSTQRPDGWALGTVIHDEGADSRPVGKVLPPNVSDNHGWFPLDKTAIATAEELAPLQAALGAAGGDALAKPAGWTDVADPLVAERIRLKEGPEKQAVISAFMATLAPSTKVVNVERIQNMAMWQSYAVKKQMMSQRSDAPHPPERKWLFHGTAPDTYPLILQQGFNRGFAGKHAVRFGRGVYFARDASYSANRRYAAPDDNGVQYMFLCRVLVGEYSLGSDGQIVPDIRTGKTLYDTTVNDVKHPTIFVTYHDAQQYPEYLVHFKSPT